MTSANFAASRRHDWPLVPEQGVRMGRWALHLSAGSLTILGLLLAGFWIRSVWTIDEMRGERIVVEGPRVTHRIFVISPGSQGRVSFTGVVYLLGDLRDPAQAIHFRRYPPDRRVRFTWKGRTSGGGRVASGGAEHSLPNQFGFIWIRQAEADTGSPGIHFISVPTWFCLLLLGLFPAWWARTVARQRRDRKRLSLGLCVSCGYDLRETVDRCAECGTATVRPGTSPTRTQEQESGGTTAEKE